MLKGLDASAVQGVLPVDRLTDCSFAILKTQQGNDRFDPMFKVNMALCLAAGIIVFPYVFAYPLPSVDPKTGKYVPGRDPKEQAKLCYDRISAFPEMRGRTIFVDLEWPSPEDWKDWGCSFQQLNSWCRDFCAELSRLSGRKVVIYTYPWWWKMLSAGEVAWAADYGLWIAAYVKKEPAEGDSPAVPAPWKTWLFWQWDGDGGKRLPNGVDSDFCVFNGTIDELKALADAPLEPNTMPIIHPRVEW